jgi:hypothetical protein
VRGRSARCCPLHGAKVDHLAVALQHRQLLDRFQRQCALGRCRQFRHQTARTLQHVDGGILALVRKLPRQHDVAIEDRAQRVRHRLVESSPSTSTVSSAVMAPPDGAVPQRSHSSGSSANTDGV